MPVLIIGFSRSGSLSRMLANAGMGVQEGKEVDREKRLVSEFDDPVALGNRGGDYRGVVQWHVLYRIKIWTKSTNINYGMPVPKPYLRPSLYMIFPVFLSQGAVHNLCTTPTPAGIGNFSSSQRKLHKYYPGTLRDIRVEAVTPIAVHEEAFSAFQSSSHCSLQVSATIFQASMLPTESDTAHVHRMYTCVAQSNLADYHDQGAVSTKPLWKSYSQEALTRNSESVLL